MVLLSLAEQLLDNEIFVLALTAVLAAVGALQYALGAEDDWIEGYRRNLWPLAHPLLAAAGRPLIRHKGEADYVCTVTATEDELEQALEGGDYHRNVVATLKFILVDGIDGRVWSDGSWVMRDSLFADRQNHCYFFVMGDKIHLFHHNEASAVSQPDDHTDGKQRHGDPESTLYEAMATAGIPMFNDVKFRKKIEATD